MTLTEIKEARAAKVAEMRGLLSTAETEKRSLNDGEKKAFDLLKAEITSLEADEQRSAYMAEADRRSAGVPVDKPLGALESRISLVDAINAQVENRSLTGALAEYNVEQKRHGVQARGVLVPHALFNETRAAQTTTTAAGIVPEDFRADQFVGILRNALVVRSLGARVLPNLRGDVVIPRQKTSATAQWLAEGDALTDTGMTFDNITMTPRHVGAITELSRQLLQQSNPAIEQLVRDDFIAVVSAAVDKALVHGDGVKQPTGLLLANGTTTATLAALDWATIQAVIEKLALLNITPNAWLTHPAVATILKTTLRETGLPGYLLDGGNVAGIPLTATNQLDAKAGTPATGRIILGDFKEMVIGTWGSVDILANPYGAAYERGGVQVRILTTMDMVARRPEAFAIANDIELYEVKRMLEIRASGTLSSNGKTLTGYAAVFNSEAALGEFSEVIRQGAFTKSLASGSSIRALYHHDSKALLGTTKGGTLQLREDAHGLAFTLALPDTTHGKDLAILVDRGDVQGCSFGFRVRDGGERWEQRGAQLVRELLDVDLQEITLTADPAYQDTSIALRSRPSVYETRGLRTLWLDTL